jgi:ferredoxin
MPYTITAACTACGDCLPLCPIDAISAGEPIYVIDPLLCVDFEECLPVCPVDAIIQIDGGATTERLAIQPAIPPTRAPSVPPTRAPSTPPTTPKREVDPR